MTRPASDWGLRIHLDSDGAQPVFLAIARAIAEGARAGRLAPGSRLPGSRELATSLGVHRNTVLSAYRELDAEGFLSTRPGGGTFVTESLPEIRPRSWSETRSLAGRATRPGFPFEELDASHVPLTVSDGALLLYGGVPDTRLVPRDAMARAYRRALHAPVDLMSYGDARGEAHLRAAVAEMLNARRGLAVGADDILITRGSQMAIALLGRALVRPSDVIAVEAPGYPPAWRAFRHAGARLVGVKVDSEGLDVDALARIAEAEPIRAVYVTPHHQYPATVVLSAARRMALLELARKKRFAIIEDDYDHEFHYEGRPVLPLASADTAGVVLYVGTLSKVLAPGLRVGYVVAPGPVRETLLALRYDFDRQGDAVSERALAELMEDGELQRHIWRTRRIYEARRENAVRLLTEALGELLTFRVPSGGMSLWAKVRKDLPVAKFHAAAEERGVLFQPGSFFSFEGRPSQHVRIGYGGVTEKEMKTAVERMREAARACR